MTVTPRAASLAATTRPMPPSPTSRTRCWLSSPISQRSVQRFSRCCCSSRGSDLAPASRPKTAYSASGSPCTPADVVKLIRELVFAKLRRLDLAATAGRHGVHPQQPWIVANRALQCGGLLVRDAIKRLRRIDELLEGLLLLGSAPKGRVADVVAGETLRRQQRLVSNEIDARLCTHDQVDQLLANRCGSHDSESLRSLAAGVESHGCSPFCHG